MAPLGITLAHFYTCGKPLVQKSANFMPSGPILKVARKSPICHEIVFFSWGTPLEVIEISGKDKQAKKILAFLF